MEFTEIKDLLKRISNFDSIYSRSIISKFFRLLLKIEKQKTNINWNYINDLCGLVNVDLLDTECQTIIVKRKGKVKSMELSSDKEDWFAYKSKALFNLGLYDDCYKISKQALDIFPKLHYFNEVWFARRIALSKKNLNDPNGAIIELLSILEKKKDWFIQKEISELYVEINENDLAFKFAILAAINFGDIEYKVELFRLLGKILKIKNETLLSFKHYSLSALIRKEKEWRISPDQVLELKEFEYAEIAFENINALKAELQTYWNSQIQQSIPQTKISTFIEGKIHKILNNNDSGINGFIKASNDQSYYFKLDQTSGLRSKLKIGTQVNFKAVPSKTDKASLAVDINIKRMNPQSSHKDT